MRFTQYYLDCLSQASYLVGDETTGRAVVVDPRRDVGEYLDDAAAAGLRVEHVIETHVHADFLSGHLELAAATGAAVIYGSGADVQFPHRTVTDGERLALGRVILEFRATPGHTPESISIVVWEDPGAAAPYGVLTGDTLFIGDVGRPDLLASHGHSPAELALQLYRSLHTQLLTLPDGTRVYPAHGAGSACGKNLSTATVSTIGAQRRTNYALRLGTADEFVRAVTEGQPPRPGYFTHVAELNREAHPVLLDRQLASLSLEEVLARQTGGAVVLDVRSPADFARGHIRGSLNVGLEGRFAEYAAAVVDTEDAIVIVCDHGRGDEARVRLSRVGLDTVIGALDEPARAFSERPDAASIASRLTARQPLEVETASTCARVVAGGGCGSATPAADPDVRSVDPELACLAALDAGLVVRRAHPLNCETPLPALTGGVVMPNARFYIRNHFGIPHLDPESWRLRVDGLVERPVSFGLAQLQAMPAASAVVTLECAGNGRGGLDPPTPGEQWGLGAASTAEWTGVPLTDVLDRVGVQAAARDVVFRGADRGQVDGRDGLAHFERSLPVEQIGRTGALLAYAMNGEELPIHHGYPLRLVVPGWYAVASVKWLNDITLIGRSFDGHFQVDRYHINGEPVTLQQVRSLIIQPASGDTVEPGELTIRGVAWSGTAPISLVEVRIGDTPWQPATLTGERQRHGWRWWELRTSLAMPGDVTIRVRATDLAGQTQPDQPRWNPLGYANNAVHEVRLVVTDVDATWSRLQGLSF